MRLSIIIPVLNSHEALRRQLLHLQTVGLPDECELILVDDGCAPPIQNTSTMPVRIMRTCDYRDWTWALARNRGARFAKGEYLLMYDLDHIASRPLIDFVMESDCPRIQFNRELAALDENGALIQDREVLESEWGLLPEVPIQVEHHRNSFAMRRDLFWELGGYVEDRVNRPYPQGEDNLFWQKWLAYQEKNGIEPPESTPPLYAFPVGRWCGDVDHNPFGLFHKLSRKTHRNYWWNRQKDGSLAEKTLYYYPYHHPERSKT